MELVGIEEAAANAQIILNESRMAKLPVIHIQHISAHPGATFFLPETDGAKINQMVTPQEDEIVVVKNFPKEHQRGQPLTRDNLNLPKRCYAFKYKVSRRFTEDLRGNQT
jgi:nicotinamidase-related amidase